MQKVDSRVGLSIGSGSASCASDLSDSEGSWAEEHPRSVSLDQLSRSGDGRLPSSVAGFDPLLHSAVVLDPDGGSWSNRTGDAGVVRDLPRTPSFRSRIHRRPEDDGIEEDLSQRRRTRRETASSWDDDVRIARHPRAPSLRFCLTLCTLTLVLLSLSNSSDAGNGGGKTSIPELEIRREEVVLPFPSSPEGSHQSQKRNARRSPGLRSKSLPHYYLTDEDRPSQPKETTKDSNQSNRKATGTRSNLAMARPAERRPVFGAGAGPQVERFVLDNAPPSKAAEVRSSDEELSYSNFSSNWTSWLAAGALIAMLVETGYKEYRQCRMDDFLEEQRRL